MWRGVATLWRWNSLLPCLLKLNRIFFASIFLLHRFLNTFNSEVLFYSLPNPSLTHGGPRHITPLSKFCSELIYDSDLGCNERFICLFSNTLEMFSKTTRLIWWIIVDNCLFVSCCFCWLFIFRHRFSMSKYLCWSIVRTGWSTQKIKLELVPLFENVLCELTGRTAKANGNTCITKQLNGSWK